MKGGKNMRKKLIAAMMAGVLSAGMFSTGVFAADTDLKVKSTHSSQQA